VANEEGGLKAANLNALIYTWTHGTKALVVLYAIVGVFSLIGLARGKARVSSYVLWPATTVVTTVVVGLASVVI
jgi:ABC-type nickel/cobalt efflux system permease component RcnA